MPRMACSKCQQRAEEARLRREAQRALIRQRREEKRQRLQDTTDQSAAQELRRRS